MHFEPNEIYHVYNRGNNKHVIFFNDDNYIFFLKKIKNEWKEYCEILCFCLMRNHFHFMIVPNTKGCEHIELGGKQTHLQNLSKVIGTTLSSYTKAINIQNQTSGNLFQKKTKAKLLSGDKKQNKYAFTCLHYIHQNPLTAKLVTKLNEWKFSSYPDYYNYRQGTLCNKNLTFELLSLSENDFKNEDVVSLNIEIIPKIF